ncbi:MAG TPA: translational machinery protein [Noviherbaspirillum sp.]|nr:translational machinery protein [Noviherbaspirillum sp.]
MPYKHVVIWVDYDQACVSRFNRELIRIETIKTYEPAPGTAATRNLEAPDTARYFNDIAEAVSDADAILILGPGFERLELLLHLRKHFPQVADRIVALEAADHPFDDEMVPWARKHFLEAA